MQRWMRSSIVPAQMNLWTCRADDLRLPFPRRLDGSGPGASPQNTTVPPATAAWSIVIK
jgi:hypothetical protein